MAGCCIVANPKRGNGSSIIVKHCTECDTDHLENSRQYAHVFHHKNVICVADAFYDLPETWQLAILLHEVGHLLAGPSRGEQAANDAVKKASGIRIRYKDGNYGQALEYIPPSLKSKARAFLFQEE